jgi:hypothetical protein
MLSIKDSWSIHLSALLITLIVVSSYHFLLTPKPQPAPTVVKVQLRAIVDDYMQTAVTATSVPAAELEQRTAAFIQKLESTIAQIGQQNGVTIYTAEAVLAGGTDITEFVRERVNAP